MITDTLATDARNEGIAKVEQSSPRQVDTIFSAIKEVAAQTNGTFTALEVRSYLKNNGIEITNLNAFGPAFLRAAKAGLISKVGYAPSQQASNHSVVVVWQPTSQIAA